MTEPKAKKILIVMSEVEAYRLVGRFVERTGMTMHRCDTGRRALERATESDYDLIVARLPLADLSLPTFTSTLRRGGSKNAETALLLLAEASQHRAALAMRSPRTEVVDLSQPEPQLDRALTSVLGVALRASARLDVELDLEAERRHFRTRNISRSGMLVEAEAPPPVGLEIAFNFTLPARFTPIHGLGQVVRHTDPTKELVPGFGIRFTAFPEGAADAIESFVEHRLQAVAS